MHATAPVTGNLTIEIVLGIPEDKEDRPVALKVMVNFDESPMVILLRL